MSNEEKKQCLKQYEGYTLAIRYLKYEQKTLKEEYSLLYPLCVWWKSAKEAFRKPYSEAYRTAEKQITHYQKLQKGIEELIGTLRDESERELLKHKYIRFLTWEELAEEMNCGVTTAKRIHARALENLCI